MVQGLYEIVRRGAGLLVSHADGRVDADAVGTIVYDAELAFSLFDGTQRSHSETAAEPVLGCLVGRPEHHPLGFLGEGVGLQDLWPFGGRAIVPRPFRGGPLVADVLGPVNLPLEDGRGVP